MTNEITNTSTTNDWTDTSPHAWRRFFARMFDAYVTGFLVTVLILILIGLVLGMINQQYLVNYNILLKNLETIDPRFVAVIQLFLLIFINSAFMGLTGNTLGKLIFGVKVLDQNNLPLNYITALKREFYVFARGFAGGLPMANLLFMYLGYQNLKKEGITYWDKKLDLKLVHRNNGVKQNILNVFGFLVVVVPMYYSLRYIIKYL